MKSMRSNSMLNGSPGVRVVMGLNFQLSRRLLYELL